MGSALESSSLSESEDEPDAAGNGSVRYDDDGMVLENRPRVIWWELCEEVR